MRRRQLAEETENVSNWLSEYSLRFDTAWVATCQTKLKTLICEKCLPGAQFGRRLHHYRFSNVCVSPPKLGQRSPDFLCKFAIEQNWGSNIRFSYKFSCALIFAHSSCANFEHLYLRTLEIECSRAY